MLKVTHMYAGMHFVLTLQNPKTLQYIMGHSSVGMTLGVYTHATQQSVFSDFYKISDMKTTSAEQSFTG